MDLFSVREMHSHGFSLLTSFYSGQAGVSQRGLDHAKPSGDGI
jgi:hypothetical protein